MRGKKVRALSARPTRIVAINPRPELDFSFEQEALEPLGIEIQRLVVRDDDELLRLAGAADALTSHRYPVRGPVIERLTRCRAILSGGVVNPEIVDRWRSRFGDSLVEGR